MNPALDQFGGLLGDPRMLLAVLVFFAAATLAFLVMAGARVRGAVKRRAASISSRAAEGHQGNGARALRHSGIKAAKQLLDYTTKHYSTGDKENMKVLRRRLMQAGIYDPRGVGFFFLARTALAVGLVL